LQGDRKLVNDSVWRAGLSMQQDDPNGLSKGRRDNSENTASISDTGNIDPMGTSCDGAGRRAYPPRPDLAVWDCERAFWIPFAGRRTERKSSAVGRSINGTPAHAPARGAPPALDRAVKPELL